LKTQLSQRSSEKLSDDLKHPLQAITKVSLYKTAVHVTKYREEAQAASALKMKEVTKCPDY